MKNNGDLGFGITPIERLRLPAHLDGSLVPRCVSAAGYPLLDADNDTDAVEKWLVQFAGSKATYERYRLEAERCLLWATIERGKPLCTLDDGDAHAYGQFLLNLHPRDRWICVGAQRRDDPAWRPFQRPMSTRSLVEAIRIVSGLWDWLDAHGYLSDNPWRRSAYLKRTSDKAVAPGSSIGGRANIATAVEWSYLDAALIEMEGQADEGIASRARALFYLAYFADIKPGEIASLRTSAITVVAADPIPLWTLTLGRRPPARREIVLLPPAREALGRYLGTRDVGPGITAGLPLIASSYSKGTVRSTSSRQTLHSIARPVFDLASAMALEKGEMLAARRLSHGSLQWLCHAFEVHAANRLRADVWAWLLLGSQFLAPPSLRPFLPNRQFPLPIDKILAGFEHLQPLWRHAECASSQRGSAF